MTRPISPPAGVDYDRKWLVLTAIAMGIFLGTIDGSIVNAALPTLVEELNTTFPVVQWVVIAYLLTLATLTLGIGRLGDMVGKKPIYTAGFAMFTTGSTLCGLAPSVSWLIAFRIVQGVGAAMIFALGFAILTEAFPPTERGQALGIGGAVVSIGIAIGPAVGGLIIDALSWRWIFLVNLPIGIIGTWTANRFVPNVKPRGGEKFDFVGAGAFFVALLTLMLGLTFAQDLGFSDGLVIGLLVIAAAATVGFVRIEQHVVAPMLDLTLFRSRLLTVNLVTGWMSFIAIAGLFILAPFYLQDVLGYDTRTMGLLLIGAPIALGVVAPVAGRLSDRIGSWPVLVSGLAIMVGGYIGLTGLSLDTSGLEYIALTVPVGVGIGVFQSPNNSAVLGSVPPTRLGVASGMLTITRITGQITGIAVVATLWSARVGARVGAAVDPTDADPAAQVAAFRDAMLAVAAMMAVAMALAIWGLVTDRRMAEIQTAHSLDPEAPAQ